MKNTYFTVGPTQIYPTVYKHLKTAIATEVLSMSHRGQKFKDLNKNTQESLRTFLSIPKSHHIFYTASSIESMERIIQNTVLKHSFHIVSGTFGKKFFEASKLLGKTPVMHEVTNSPDFTLNSISVPKNCELICLTQNDTSTGMAIPNDELYALIKKNPKSLVAIDGVSSVPYGTVDFKLVDMLFFSIQKLFGLPAGLGILVVSDKALKKARLLEEKGHVTGTYRRFTTLFETLQDFQTVETPNTLAIYLLEKVVNDFIRIGKPAIDREITQKAQLLYDFFTSHKTFRPHVQNIKYRSNTTLVIDVKGESEGIRNYLAKHNMIVGAGYGPHKKDHIRIANFPAHSIKDMKKLIARLQLYKPTYD